MANQSKQAMSVAQKNALMIAAVRKRASEDLLWFAREILGYKDLNEHIHGEICRMLMRGGECLVLIPRGTFKSTLCTVAYSVWSIIQNPNIRMLITNATQDMANSYLREIKAHFERNERLRLFFGDYTGERWNETEIITGKRTQALKEPTLRATGVGGNMVGWHGEKIICDDLVNETDRCSASVRAGKVEWFEHLQSLLEPNAQTVIVGTRWHHADLYGELMKEGERFLESKNMIVRGAYLESGELWFPERLSEEFLADKKMRQSVAVFSAHYLNKPIADDYKLFTDFTFYNPQEITRAQLHGITTYCDPALGKNRNSDTCAIITAGLDRFGKRVVLDETIGIYKPEQILDKILFHCNKWMPSRVGVESNGFQQLLVDQLTAKLKTAKLFNIRIIPVNNSRSKLERIDAISPLVNNGNVLFPMNACQDLLQQLDDYPVGRYDDGADALAGLLELMDANQVQSQPVPRMCGEKRVA